MPSTGRLAPERLHKRMCLSCGRIDPRLQGENGAHVYECPACGADLYARPARSYAEMEGLNHSSTFSSGRYSTFERLSALMLTAQNPQVQSRLRRRRFLHMTILAAALVIAMALSAAAAALTLLLFV